MEESENSADQHDAAPGGQADAATISSLIADLARDDEMVRTNARQSLVAIAGPAVPLLIDRKSVA